VIKKSTKKAIKIAFLKAGYEFQYLDESKLSQ
jgi:hypothetical protein